MLSRLACGFVLALCAALPSRAQQTASPPPTPGEDIIVYGRAIKRIGSASSASQGTVGYRDFQDRPVARVGELVENVPGVIATQHSGTGKANQYFLRGFNLDHGTDFAGFVDGVPINMRSHGHGQGYLDLNFLIPELVERIDYRKGPYFADVGDFAAAGTVQFSTLRRLARPMVEATVGSFGYYRALAAGSSKAGSGDLLLALDGTLSNGPWRLDEDLRKVNGALRYTTGPGDGALSIGLTGYHATWNSTDQVPQRAIDGGLIPRLGFIDGDLGGRNTRIGLTANGQAGATTFVGYATYYNFGLTSNFTYFLDDPVNGDEFQQRDRRVIAGGTVTHNLSTRLGAIPVDIDFGTDLRFDHVGKIGLYRSIGGQRSAVVREDSLKESSVAAFGTAQFHLSQRLRASFGLRADHYRFEVDAGFPANGGRGSDTIVTPKVALAWQAGPGIEFYANYGEGFHSNDVRGAVISVDPVTGRPAERVPVLVRARGAELGGRIETRRLSASLVGFILGLDSELVFVGDAGATEPNDATHRYGAEATLFWRPTDWLTLDGSAAVTRARFRGVEHGQHHIPGAVTNVVAAGAAADLGRGLSASLRLRHFGAAPLIEDDSARSRPTTLLNGGVYYQAGRARFGLDLFNILNSKDADISYSYASRLPGEPAEGVEDLHLHPVEPRQVRASIRLTL